MEIEDNFSFHELGPREMLVIKTPADANRSNRSGSISCSSLEIYAMEELDFINGGLTYLSFSWSRRKVVNERSSLPSKRSRDQWGDRKREGRGCMYSSL
ncbi:hypothetical protein H6P81_000699 [Aristolochia fimbriata]|uniref:Uncharacterized protein n=1 Tax=Aristolochia fimbriata TaxID=158543 RepID=A0AAV7F7Z6_ARIFI|nr:hypothetical protein H6P81_000699 [Aristolochia fimbriata]